jgi:anti-sigma factor RsiW
MTTCAEISGLLDDYVNATLGPVDRARVEEHVSGCEPCRAELAGVRTVVVGARALPASITPPRDLWTGIEARLQSADRRATRTASRPQLWGRIAAAIGFILLGAGLATVWRQSASPSGFAAEQARYNAASAELASKLAAGPPALSSITRAVVERNLAIVDAAIQEAERALESDPGNGALEQMLRVRYEQRLDLLRRATDADRRQS